MLSARAAARSLRARVCRVGAEHGRAGEERGAAPPSLPGSWPGPRRAPGRPRRPRRARRPLPRGATRAGPDPGPDRWRRPGPVDPPALDRGGAVVDRRTDQRVAEPDHGPRISRSSAWAGAAASGVKPRSRPARHSRAGSPVGSAAAAQQQRLGAGRKMTRLPQEPGLQPAAERQQLGQRLHAGELAGRELRPISMSASGLPRVCATIRVPTPSSRSPSRRRAAGAPARGQPQQMDTGQAREPGRPVSGFAHGQQEGDGVGVQAAGHEREHGRGLAVEPLSVVDDAQQSSLAGHVRQQRQGGQGHQEPVGRPPVRSPNAEFRASRWGGGRVATSPR